MAALQPVWSPIRQELQNARDEMCYPQTKESHLDQILCFVVKKSLQYRLWRETQFVATAGMNGWLGSAATCNDNSTLHLGTSNLQNLRHYTNPSERVSKPKTLMKAETVVTKTHDMIKSFNLIEIWIWGLHSGCVDVRRRLVSDAVSLGWCLQTFRKKAVSYYGYFQSITATNKHQAPPPKLPNWLAIFL